MSCIVMTQMGVKPVTWAAKPCEPLKLRAICRARRADIPGDEVPLHFGRKSKTWTKKRADFCRDLAVDMGKLSDVQVEGVFPLLRDDMAASLRTLRSLDTRNKGRFREENNLGGMLRSLTSEELATLKEVVEMGAVGSLHGVSAEVESLAVSWRDALVTGDKEATARVVDMAVQAGVSPRDLLELVRAAREEHEATSKGAEDARAEESDEAEVLEGFEDVVALMKEGTPGRPSKPKKKHGKKLLRALREVAGAHLAETSAA